MWKAIIEIVKDVIWFWRRKTEQKDDPLIQHRKRTDELNKNLAKGDLSADNGGAALDELNRLRIIAKGQSNSK